MRTPAMIDHDNKLKKQQKWVSPANMPRCDCCKYCHNEKDASNILVCKFDLLGFITKATASCAEFIRIDYPKRIKRKPKEKRITEKQLGFY